MQWSEIKNAALEWLIITAVRSFSFCTRTAATFVSNEDNKAFLRSFRVKKIRTKTKNVLIFHDEINPTILFKSKRLLGEWRSFDMKDMPAFAKEQIQDPLCTAEEKEYLISRIIELSAFR